MSRRPDRPRIKWPPVLVKARRIVESYGDMLVTLRQLFYRLVSAQVIPNTTFYYGRLSDPTAEVRPPTNSQTPLLVSVRYPAADESGRAS